MQTKTKSPTNPLTRCAMCKRALTDSTSITRGIGPECAAKLASVLGSLSVTAEQLATWEAVPAAERWVKIAFKAIAAGNLRHARTFFDAAGRAMNDGLVAVPVNDSPDTNGVQMQLHAVVEPARTANPGEVVYRALKPAHSGAVYRVTHKYQDGTFRLVNLSDPQDSTTTRPSSCQVFGRVIGYRFILTG